MRPQNVGGRSSVANSPPEEQREAAGLDLLEVFLRGQWRHVIFLTYTCDLPFFEAFVLPLLIQRGAQYITIAADGRWLAKQVPHWMAQGDVREAGQSYAVCGAHVPGVFHPKVIIGVGERGGAALVGSGNVSPFGFSFGGELFSLVEWAGRDAPPLAREAWQACREIARCVAVECMFSERVETMGEALPSLASDLGQHAVRHNLRDPLLNQLIQAVGQQRVEEIIAWAPFADKSLLAVRTLVDELRPAVMTLGLQPRLTNVDGELLAQIAAQTSAHIQWQFIELQRTKEQPSSVHSLIHAKGILVTLEDGTDLLLAGSPNLTRSALLCTADEANLEVAILTTGVNLKHVLFSDAPIRLGGEMDPRALKWVGTASDEDGAGTSFMLVGAYWDGQVLTMEIRGDCPESVRALLDGRAGYTPALQDGRLVVPLPANAPPRTVSLAWDGGTSGPVLVANLPQLSEKANEQQAVSQKYALPDLETGGDDVFVALLMQLGEVLITSPSDIVRALRGLTVATLQEEAQEVADSGSLPAQIDLSDIDFDALAQHPSARRYVRSSGFGGNGRSVQSWLDEVLAHFQYLQDRRRPKQAPPSPIVGDDEEGDDAENEPQSSPQIRRWPVSQKVRTWVRNRVKRFILGLRSKEFLRLIPADWIVRDYVIFLNILEFLQARAHAPGVVVLSPQAYSELALDLLTAFWGSDEESGFWSTLDEEGACESGLVLIQYRADALTMATAARLIFSSGEVSRRAPFSVASFAQSADRIGMLTPRVAEDALVYLGSDDQDSEALLASIRSTVQYFDWEHYLSVLAARRGLRRARLEELGFAQGKALLVEPREPCSDMRLPLAVFADCLDAWQPQEPERSVFQMRWGAGGDDYIYIRRGCTWRRVRRVNSSKPNNKETLASGIEPSEFAAWPQREVPLLLDGPAT